MRTTAAAVLVLCVLPRAAWAFDWSLRSTASETVELNDNMFLRHSPLGATLASYSTITANAEEAELRTRLGRAAHAEVLRTHTPQAQASAFRALFANIAAAALLAFTIFFYVVV